MFKRVKDLIYRKIGKLVVTKVTKVTTGKNFRVAVTRQTRADTAVDILDETNTTVILLWGAIALTKVHPVAGAISGVISVFAFFWNKKRNLGGASFQTKDPMLVSKALVEAGLLKRNDFKTAVPTPSIRLIMRQLWWWLSDNLKRIF